MQVPALEMTPVSMSAQSHLGEEKQEQVKNFGSSLACVGKN